MQEIDPKDFREAKLARRRAAGLHLFDPEVSLIDVGWRIKESQKTITRELTVRVHKSVKRQKKEFEVFAARYPERIVDADRIGFPIDIIEAKYPVHWFWWGGWDTPIRARRFDPLQAGISISNDRMFGYGTLGGFVTDKDSGQTMLLSNWHVLVGSSFLQPDAKILQPGLGDGGGGEVAQFTRHAMDAGIDAAVAVLNNSRKFVNEELEIGAVAGVAEPTLDMVLTKSGRGTGLTRGIVTGVAGVTKLSYGGFERIIRHTVHIARYGTATVSGPGDSGSWWLAEPTKQAIGLHFAGSDYPQYALAIAMPQVLAALDVEVIPGNR